jgi:hypothetical protein
MLLGAGLTAIGLAIVIEHLLRVHIALAIGATAL